MHGIFSPRIGWVFALMLIFELIVTPLAIPSRQVFAAVNGTEHCTDTDVALRSKRIDPDDKQDIPAEGINGQPILVRPDSPFMVHYSETDSVKAIIDPSPNGPGGVNATQAGN